MSQKSKIRVVFVLCDSALSTSITLPIELLNSAAHIARAVAAKGTRPPRLEILVATVDGKPKKTQIGIEIAADIKLDDVEDADIIFIPALWRNPVPVVQNHPSIGLWISRMFSRETSMIAGVGTGCYFLAEAGLLDHRLATTHWYFFDNFETRYPQVKLQRNYFITQSGRLYCTGSVNTLADLTVHFIDQYYGDQVATEVERHFFHDIRRNYHKLALLEDARQLHHDESIAYAQSFLSNNLASQIKFDELAAETGMSRRSFDRKFKQILGASPLSYLQRIRMEMARDLVKNTNLDVSEIMYRVGYQDSAHFSSLFKKMHGTTPRQYRTTVRAKLFSTSA